MNTTTHTSSPGAAELCNDIKSRAKALGFDTIQITDASLPRDIEDRLRASLDAGHHATMSWMEGRIAERAHPQSLWGDARSVIMLGINYGPETNPLTRLDQRDLGNISVYAQNEDYHDIIKKRLKQLGRWLVEQTGCEIKVFVDTAPVMEKPLAMQSGLGWQGKHTNLVSREFGSWLFLGSIFTTLALEHDTPETDHCGNCRACLDICPTKAFPAPYQLDARACISYLTIEHKGPIPEQYRKAMGNRIYGCDDCLAVCPWNKFAKRAHEQKLIARDDVANAALTELSQLDDESFRAFFRKSPVKRIGRDRFVRNVLIAIGNSEDPGLLSYARALTDDASPIVAEAANWAVDELNTYTGRIDDV